MPGWTASTITEMTNAVLILAIFIFGTFHGKIRKNQRRYPTMFLATALFGFVASFFRGFSYLFNNVFLYQLYWMFLTIAILCMIVWLEQIVFEIPRTAVRSLFTFLGGMTVAFSWVAGNITTSIDGNPVWTGTWAFFGQLFVAGMFIYVLGFFIRVGFKAPWKVRIPLVVLLAISLLYAFGIDIVRPFYPGVPDWAWSVMASVLASLSVGIIVLICALFPEFLSIITYTLDRLIVIHVENGVLLFSHSWVKRKKDDVDLIAPLLQALQSMSFEVLKLGHMTELHLEEGNLMFQKSEHVIVGIISTRSTVYLRTRLSMFIDAFEIEFKQELEKQTPDLTQFQRAKDLVGKIFQAIPLDTTRFGPWRRHREEKDYLSPEEDPELIEDLKSLFSDEA
ncbi:MAG: hypothetical protein Q6373_022080 [Candidatus Sigynarchaeota archaeon]